MTAAAAGPCSASSARSLSSSTRCAGSSARAQMREVGLAAGGVDHHGKAARDAAHDQVVEHAALRVGQHGVAQAAFAEAREVARHQGLEGLRGVLAMHQHLAHVRDVEQRGRVAALPVLGHDAGGILHGQGPAGEIDHPGAALVVHRMQRRAARAGSGWLVTVRSRPGPPEAVDRRACVQSPSPLCPRPERFIGRQATRPT